MTDFTMDELTDLLFCVKDHTGYQEDSIHNNLINKIQFMIDNYCENDCVMVRGESRKVSEFIDLKD